MKSADDAAARSSELSEIDTVAIATAYYLEDLSKVEIAERFGISRFQVARILQRARESGVVKVEVRSPLGVNIGLSKRLGSSLDLAAAWVVDATEGQDVIDVVGESMARALQAAVQRDDLVGVSWSRALASMSGRLQHLPPCVIVQLAGHASHDDHLPDSSEIVRRLARISRGKARPISAPLLVTDESALQSLLRQPDIAAATASFGDVDVAAISVGAWQAGESTVYAIASERDRVRALELGAVGEVNGRLFDAAGRPVEGAIGNRVLGMHLDQLARVPKRIAGAFGAVRARATLAAVRGGYVSDLVVDRALAEALLALV